MCITRCEGIEPGDDRTERKDGYSSGIIGFLCSGVVAKL
jgi:hypothetical protein